MLLLPILYVGSEGAWYLATGESYFAPGSAYRTFYVPLDWAGDRWLPVYQVRYRLANAWLLLGDDSSQGANIQAVTGPWHALLDDAVYFPPDNEFKLSREAAAKMQFEAEQDAAAPGAADATSCPVEIAYSADD